MRRRYASVLLALVLTLVPMQKSWAVFGFGDIVFDPRNYGQNLLMAARTLTMINNQIRSLKNEVTVLRNMAKNLQGLDYSSLTQLSQAVSQINLLMGQAQGMAFNVTAADAEFAARFPKQYADLVTDDQLAQDARKRWEYSLDGYRNTMRIQAYVSEGVAVDQTVMTALVSQSQSAVGSLQAQQATNQLIALGVEQTSKTQQLMAAQYRAEAIEQARYVAAEEQGRARFKHFAGDGKAYTPLP